MSRSTVLAIGCAVVMMLPTSEPRAQLTPNDFVVDDATGLAELCSAETNDAYYVQAIHMCHGFVGGVAQYAFLLFGASGGSLICLPDPQPSRDEAIAEFVVWLRAHPEFANVEAPEAIVRFMAERFPCP